MKTFLYLLRSSWVSAVIAGVLGTVSGLASLGLIAQIHQALTSGRTDTETLPSLFAAGCLTVLVTQVAASWVRVRFSQATAARLRYDLCSKIIAAPLNTLEAAGPQRLLGTLVRDVDTMTAAVAVFPGVCANIVVVAAGLLYIAHLSVPLATAAIVTTGLGSASILFGLYVANRHFALARSVQVEVLKHLRAMVHGIKELKVNRNRCVDFVYDLLLPADSQMRHNLMRALTVQGFVQAWGRLLFFVGIGLVLFVWPQTSEMSMATLTGTTLMALYLSGPLKAILEWVPSISDAAIAVGRIKDLGLLSPTDQPEPRLTALPDFRSLELRDVSYQHHSEDDPVFALGPLNFEVSAGEVLLIAGGNGSGKTTLAKVLTGLYRPDSGALYWNGRLVADRNRADYRQLFSTVFADGHLFDRLLGLDVNRLELQRWLNLLGVQDSVDPDTGIIKDDVLSGGHRNRLALLVACLDDRPLFVFDEWAAEQDPVLKNVFYRQIVPELQRRGKSVIVMTHDDHDRLVADKTLILTDGRLVPGLERRAA